MTLQPSEIRKAIQAVLEHYKGFVVNFIDVDGTLCPSIFYNLKKDNQDEASLSPEFMQKLRDIEPFLWTKYDNQYWWIGNVNIIITGRLEQHRAVTMEWIYKHFTYAKSGEYRFSFISVPFNNQLGDEKVSYRDYYTRKAGKLARLMLDWATTLASSHLEMRINVFEDDVHVLQELHSVEFMRNFRKDQVNLWVVQNGQVPVAFIEK